jgi:hypothetical protein
MLTLGSRSLLFLPAAGTDRGAQSHLLINAGFSLFLLIAFQVAVNLSEK